MRRSLFKGVLGVLFVVAVAAAASVGSKGDSHSARVASYDARETYTAL